MTIRQGLSSDLTEIWPLVQKTISDMNEKGNPQWGPDYPSMSDFALPLSKGELYAACGDSGKISGVVVLNTDEEPCYAELSGWKVKPPALVVHKMCVSPQTQRQGIATALFQFAFELAQKQGLQAVHMDTYCMNGRMQCLVHKLGFEYIGNVHFPIRPLAYRAYEKVF